MTQCITLWLYAMSYLCELPAFNLFNNVRKVCIPVISRACFFRFTLRSENYHKYVTVVSWPILRVTTTIINIGLVAKINDFEACEDAAWVCAVCRTETCHWSRPVNTMSLDVMTSSFSVVNLMNPLPFFMFWICDWSSFSSHFWEITLEIQCSLPGN